MNNKKYNRHCAFIKFGSYEHMKAFYEKGEMYFNTFEYFKKLENSGDGRSDKNEYASVHYAGEGIKNLTLKIYSNDNPNEVYCLEGGKDLKTFTLDYGNDKKYTHLYSMSYLDIDWILENDLLIDYRNFAKDKNYAVLIHDILNFNKMFIDKMKDLKVAVDGNVVEYVDKDTYSGKIGAFRKFKEYEYQNEFRIAVDFDTLEPIKIYIGSLKNVAKPPVNIKEFYSSDCKISRADENGKIYMQSISNKSVLNKIDTLLNGL